MIKDILRTFPEFQTGFRIYFFTKKIQVYVGINIDCVHIFGFLKIEESLLKRFLSISLPRLYIYQVEFQYYFLPDWGGDGLDNSQYPLPDSNQLPY